MAYATTSLASPGGRLRLVSSEAALVAILWEDDRPGRVRLGACQPDERHPVLRETARQLDAYFAGTLEIFTLDLAPIGTEFQRAVWQALLAIPYGETRSYGSIASMIGRPKASRAVGAAIGRNPLSIVVPCHRVVGASGTLTGFAGGLNAKRRLLACEAGKPWSLAVA